MDIRSFILVPVCFVILFVLTVCSEPDYALRIGSNQWPGYEPVYLARELQVFDRDDVHLVELPSSTDVIQYLRNGSLNGAMLTLDEVIALISEGIALKVILVLDVSDGSDSVVAHPSIKTISDLEGKRVGVELSALGALILKSLLEDSKLSSRQVHVATVTADMQEREFLNRNIDAVVTFEPTRSRLLESGAVEIYNSSNIPGRIVHVLAIRDEVISTHQIQIKSLVEGYFLAREYMDSHYQLALSKMAPRLMVSSEVMKNSLSGMQLPDRSENILWLTTTNAKLVSSATSISKAMQNNQLISSIPNLTSLADGRFLNMDNN